MRKHKKKYESGKKRKHEPSGAELSKTESKTASQVHGVAIQLQPASVQHVLRQQMQRPSFWRTAEFREWVSIFVNVALVFINIALAVFTYYLYSLASQQTDAAKQSAVAAVIAAEAAKDNVEIFKDSLIPNLLIDEYFNNYQLDGGYDKFTVRVKIKNSEGSTAKNVRAYIRLDHGFKDFSGEVPAYSVEQYLSDIAVGDKRDIEATTNNRRFVNSTKSDSLFLHIKIVYTALGDSFTTNIGIRSVAYAGINDYTYCSHNSRY